MTLRAASMGRKFAVTVAIFGSATAFLALAAPAQADTIRVTRTGDPAPNGCANNGCTLREAVIAANTRPGPDTVLARSGRTYQLARAGSNEELAQTGDLDLIQRTTVDTTGRQRATVDANLLDRAFDAYARVTLSNLVIINAQAPGPGDESQGGAVRSSGGGLVLRGVRVLDAGSATFNGAVEDVGEGGIVLVRSRVVDSSARGVADFSGGGVRLERSTVDGSGNEGIAEAGDGGVTLIRSAVVNGESRGGIFTQDSGTNRIVRSRVVSNNTPGFTAGGIEVSDTSSLIIDRSTIAGNVGALAGGVYISADGTLTMRRSTISGNQTGLAGTAGGLTLVGEAQVVNSTIAGNTGGGIRALNGATAALNAVTIARNTAGAGIRVDSGGFALLGNSLLALNLQNGTPSDCDDPVGTGIDSGGHNLRSSAAGGCAFDGPGDFVRQNPRIGQLADNGGPTRTIALRRGSPAINRAGDDAPGIDQRGVRRRNPDIGAFERR